MRVPAAKLFGTDTQSTIIQDRSRDEYFMIFWLLIEKLNDFEIMGLAQKKIYSGKTANFIDLN